MTKESGYRLLLAFVASVVFVLIAWRLWLGDKSVSEENHLMENGQAIALVVSIGLHVWQRGRCSLKACRVYHGVLAALCLSVLVRELDIDKFGEARIWEPIETVIRIGVAAVWIFVLTGGFRTWSELWAAKARIVWAPSSLCTYAGIALYLSSWFFDKRIVPLEADISQFIEESLQFTATMCFLAGATALFRKE